MRFKCDCFQPVPFTDHDGDTVCTRCRRVLRVGPLGVNRMGMNLGRGHGYGPATHGEREWRHRRRNDRRAERE